MTHKDTTPPTKVHWAWMTPGAPEFGVFYPHLAEAVRSGAMTPDQAAKQAYCTQARLASAVAKSVGVAEEAGDVHHDFLVRMGGGVAAKFDPARGAPGALMSGVMRCVAQERRRADARLEERAGKQARETAGACEGGAASDPCADAERAELLGIVERWFSHLSRDERRALRGLLGPLFGVTGRRSSNRGRDYVLKHRAVKALRLRASGQGDRAIRARRGPGRRRKGLGGRRRGDSGSSGSVPAS